MAVKSKPYIPSFLRSALSGSRPIQLTFRDVRDTNIQSTSSFIYDPLGTPLKSTQQLNVDWSRFENHTFFMSAEAKVNLAFDQIINSYPFDGTRAENELFFEKLTGFDNWVFEMFPKFRGQLHFSGTQPGEDTDGTKGVWIGVKDHAGSLFPELAKNASGESVINPTDGSSLTIEMQLYIPGTITSGVQMVCQKLSGSTHGFSLYLMPTSSLSQVEARFSVVSGAYSMTTTAMLDKGAFNHVAVTWNRDDAIDYLQFFKTGESVDVSRSQYVFDDLGIDSIDFFIATGSAMVLGNTTITPVQTFSGSMDELRIFHSVRTPDQLAQFSRKPIFTTEDLKLYYRFNEPPPPLTLTSTDSINGIVIDSSGNSLHALVNNFTGSLRQDVSQDPKSRMIYEKDITAPILFPAHTDVLALNNTLLTSASEYDSANPNLITRLIPQHYLLEGAAFEGFDEPEGLGGSAYGGSGIPGQGKLGNVQLMLSFLYIYARFFDEIKLFIDAFSTVNSVDYLSASTVPDNFVPALIEQYGFHLPPLFNDSTLEQYIRAENIDFDISNSANPLRYVQNQLLRRALINLPDVIRSKGTQHSIKAFLRTVGIDPENSMRIREFGGPTERHLSFARETKRDTGSMVEFTTSSFAVSPFLSASRFEPGYPPIQGTFVKQVSFPPNGVSNNRNDGLLTSGSWTVELLAKWTPVLISSMSSATQSLARLCTTGSVSSSVGVAANLLAISSSTDSRVILYVRPGTAQTSPVLSMSLPLPGAGIFDNDKWNISFGCERNDSLDSKVSSSYFLRAAKQAEGRIEHEALTSTFFLETAGVTGEVNAFRSLTASTASASGTFLVVGEGQQVLSGSGTGYLFLNDTSVVGSEARATFLRGLVSNMRFWSRALELEEWREHVRNFKSLGVIDPLVNYNFVTTRTGSFEKVRLDSLTKQETKRAEGTGSAGRLIFLDFSLNGNHMTGSGFPVDSDSLKTEIFDYGSLSPDFDEASSNEKIRSRGFLNQDLVDQTPWAGVAPVHEIVKSEEPTDDVRFTVEFSLVDALNRDIITLFATLDAIDNALGSPELVYSPDYPDLDRLRWVYFNRIHDKLNFKAFLEFFRWFETSIGTFIEQLVPRKTAFKGTNFVIESHMLERHKLEYLSNEIYLGEADRGRIKDVLLLQQVVGSCRKY